MILKDLTGDITTRLKNIPGQVEGIIKIPDFFFGDHPLHPVLLGHLILIKQLSAGVVNGESLKCCRSNGITRKDLIAVGIGEPL